MLPDPREQPTVPLALACRALGTSHNNGCELVRRGEFPVAVIRVGRAIRVPTAALLRLLSLEGSGASNDFPPTSLATSAGPAPP